MEAENAVFHKNKISKFWGWVTVETYDHSVSSQFPGSYKKNECALGVYNFRFAKTNNKL